VNIGGLYNLFFYQPIYNLLLFVYGIVRSFPLSIIIMTIIVRSAMIPLFMRQLRSTKAMQELAPRIKELQAQYKGDPVAANQAVQALYKENGVNPLMGCLPLLIQMPFLWGLYGAFNTILHNDASVKTLQRDLYPLVRPIFGNSAPDLHFLWLNLGQTDPIFLLPVIAAILTFMQIRMAMTTQKAKPKPGDPPDPTAATNNMMQFMMPALTLFMGTRFPAGLALYWCVTTLFTVVQQYFVNGRNWGGLFRGIPALEHLGSPMPVPAIVDSAPVSGIGRGRKPQVVVEAETDKAALKKTEAVERKPVKALPAPAEVDTPNVVDTDEDPVEAAIAEATNQIKRPTPARAVTRPTATPKKDAVKLVTNGARNGTAPTSQPIRVATAGSSSAAAPRTGKTPTRPVGTTTRARSAGASNSQRPASTRSGNQPRKKK
jgi:YidC/Oxa1 family membrane protein insertase